MSSYVIRNLPEELHKQLKVKAAQEESTINKLVIEAIKKFLGKDNG